MTKHLLYIFVAGVIIFFFLSVKMFAESDNQTSYSLLLPQKHNTHLTRAEKRGKELYEYYCYLCHGSTGKADGFNSTTLSISPAKLTDSNRIEALSVELVNKTIREGGASRGLSPLMPPWGGVFTDTQLADLTSFIRNFSKELKEQDQGI